MREFTAQQRTETLCTALEMLDSRRLSPEETLTRATICEVLEARYPAVDAALQKWAEDDTTTGATYVATLVAAAREAARGHPMTATPTCEKHGPMVTRPPTTKEQAFCGTWYACGHVEYGHTCRATALIPSSGLLDQLAEQRRATQ